MRIFVAALAIVTLLAVISPPAQAQVQSTLQIRYWGTGLYFNQPFIGFSATDSGNGWGATLRFDSTTTPWSFSARYDSVSVTPSNWPWNGAKLYDGNVHYRFGPDLDTYFGLFAGWGHVSPNATGFPVNDGSGLKYGAEFLWRQPSGWYVAADAAFGSWSTTGFNGAAGSNITDYRAAIGYEFQGGWGLEGGYRYFSWRLGSGGGCPIGCEWRFSGLTAAITFRR